MTQNELQKSCSGLETEFVAGEVYGLRLWHPVSIYKPASETGLVGQFGQVWPYWTGNVAKCLREETLSYSMHLTDVYYESGAQELIAERLRRGIRSSAPPNTRLGDDDINIAYEIWAEPSQNVTAYTYTVSPEICVKPTTELKFGRATATATVPAPCSRPISPDCTCGFYAYTNIDSIYTEMQSPLFKFWKKPLHLGLVRAYGHVTLGEKGFRAEKADIIAIVPHVVDYRDFFNYNYNYLPPTPASVKKCSSTEEIVSLMQQLNEENQ